MTTQTRTCKHHGDTDFVLENRGYYRCKKCRTENVVRSRRNRINRLKEEHGGKCERCGYSKCMGALEFHHLDPTVKEFQIGTANVSYERAKAEVANCELVCANCHREIHSSLV